MIVHDARRRNLLSPRDGDCAYTEWSWRYQVIYAGPDGSGRVVIDEVDSMAAAEQVIDARCSAMDTTVYRYSDSAKLDWYAMPEDCRRGFLSDGSAQIYRGGRWEPLWGRTDLEVPERQPYEGKPR